MGITELLDTAAWLRDHVHPLSGDPSEWNDLIDYIGEADVVLIGEASHGTAEFYRYRVHLTKRLIAEKGFAAVAVEADWPDAYRVHRYVSGTSRDVTSQQALGDFIRFPRWMWRNTEVVGFVGWLHAHNASLPPSAPRVGFYGLDLYSLHASIEAVLRFLDATDKEAAARARERYACFDHVGHASEARTARFSLPHQCEEEAVAQLMDLRRLAMKESAADGPAADELFYAEQNARLIKNAERYYRAMLRSTESWNLRDRHMVETLDSLTSHLAQQGIRPKLVLWAHNSHLGDARATQMGEAGEINVGQLVRERYGAKSRLVGFSTYDGTVTAASEWDGDAACRTVRPALPDSYEALFHEVGMPSFFLTAQDRSVMEMLQPARLERAIGVIYRPDTERVSHYFRARLPAQFDAVLHLDRTHAVTPLDRPAGWTSKDAPETFPTGY